MAERRPTRPGRRVGWAACRSSRKVPIGYGSAHLRLQFCSEVAEGESGLYDIYQLDYIIVLTRTRVQSPKLIPCAGGGRPTL